MELSELQDKCRGSLVGGAVGDALGYEVEFMSLSSIRKRFGEKGISRYVLHNGVAQFSDDTQMTLFTLEGMMNAIVNSQSVQPEYVNDGIKKAYLNWYKTQTESPTCLVNSWIGNLKTLWSRRAPGMTCMSALQNLANGLDVENNSKGCGGVMRVAPIGIYYACHSDLIDLKEWKPDQLIITEAYNAAALTHHHFASHYASALQAYIAYECMKKSTVSQHEFKFIVESGLRRVAEVLPSDKCWLNFKKLITLALEMGMSDTPKDYAICKLGEGWVGDEAIAIAIFSVMRNIDNFEDCIVCAVNHDGDSDSTGAIAGNIIGAILGYHAIPDYYLKALEIEPILVSAADDLCAEAKINEINPRIKDRYVNHLPAEIERKYLL